MLNLYNIEKIRELESAETPARGHLREWRASRPPFLASVKAWAAALSGRRGAPGPDAEAGTAAGISVERTETLEGGSPAA